MHVIKLGIFLKPSIHKKLSSVTSMKEVQLLLLEKKKMSLIIDKNLIYKETMAISAPHIFLRKTPNFKKKESYADR